MHCLHCRALSLPGHRRQIRENLQGVLVSLTNLTGVAGPLLFAFTFSQTRQSADGTVWLIGTALYGLLLAMCLLIGKTGTGGGHLLTGAIQAALLCGMVDGIRAYRLP